MNKHITIELFLLYKFSYVFFNFKLDTRLVALNKILFEQGIAAVVVVVRRESGSSSQDISRSLKLPYFSFTTQQTELLEHIMNH